MTLMKIPGRDCSTSRRMGTGLAAAAILVCGTVAAPPSASAISHGTDSASGTAPWMATLAFPGQGSLTERGYCGGTLISPTRVLTAGHCVMDKSPDDFEVHLGADKLTRSPGPAHTVRGWFRYPDWRQIDTKDGSFATHDMAVVVLEHPVRGIAPARIASPGAVTAAIHAQATGTTYGHGATGDTDPEKGGMTDRLQQARMRMLPPKRCDSDIPQSAVGSGFCVTGKPASSSATAPSICPGDSGGPLLLSTPDGRKVAGVLSAQSGNDCDGSPHQGQYANPAGWRRQALRPHPKLAPTGKVRVSGSPTVGTKMHGSASTHTPGHVTVRYSWYREETGKDNFKYFVPVKGGNSPTLTVPPKAAGHRIKLIATLSNRAGTVNLEKTTSRVHR